MQSSLLYQSKSVLGEGAMWHEARKSCFWVDIEGRRFFEMKWSDKKVRLYQLDYRISLISKIAGSDDTLLLGLQGGLAIYSIKDGKLNWLVEIEKEKPGNRCNDGICDSEGRLWIGTMDLGFKKEEGSLYCIDKNCKVQKKLPAVTISNGMAWSPDNSKLYYIDTPTQKVRSFKFDVSTGDIEFEKDIIEIHPDLGSPDGMVIDNEGMLWIAHWGGFGVYRWNPHNGQLLDKIEVAAPNVSSCAFAGELLNKLIITTATQEMTETGLEQYPASGDLFVADPGVSGVCSNAFTIE